MKKVDNFTEGRLFAPLIRFALPVFFALLLQALYGAVDLLVVGQFGGELADVYVSAVSTGSQVLQTLTVTITGLSMGLTVFVGEKIGAGKREEAGKIIGSGIFLFGIIAIVVTIGMLIADVKITEAMHAPTEAFDETVSYIKICSAGTVFIVAYNLLGSVFRGIGDSKTPLITVAIACVLNIFGDLLLVAVFHMGASGAALATVFAQAVSVLLSLLIIRRQNTIVVFGLKDIRPVAAYIKRILRLGIPVSLQDLLVSFSFLAIIAIVNNIGLVESAGVGVAEKVCIFLMLVPSAFMQSMSAFVAQNIGAGKFARARKALQYGILTSLAAGVVLGDFSFFHGEMLASVFAQDAELIGNAADYLKAYAIDCLFTSFLFCFTGYFNGCGYTTFVMIQGVIGAILVRVPVSYLMSKILPVSLFKIGLATPISTVIQIILCVSFFAFTLRRQKKQLADNFYNR